MALNASFYQPRGIEPKQITRGKLEDSKFFNTRFYLICTLRNALFHQSAEAGALLFPTSILHFVPSPSPDDLTSSSAYYSVSKAGFASIIIRKKYY